MYAVIVTASVNSTPVVRTMPAHYSYKQAKRALLAFTNKTLAEYKAMNAADEFSCIDTQNGFLITAHQDHNELKSVEIRLARLMGEIRDPTDI